MAALEANKKEKPNGVISARVLFDGSNGIAVNRRTRIRDQERAPVAADLKRVMREKARLGERTFALTADVAEAHRQIPIHPRDWHLLGCQVEVGSDVYINEVGLRSRFRLILLVTSGLSTRPTDAVHHWSNCQYVAPVGGR